MIIEPDAVLQTATAALFPLMLALHVLQRGGHGPAPRTSWTASHFLIGLKRDYAGAVRPPQAFSHLPARDITAHQWHSAVTEAFMVREDQQQGPSRKSVEDRVIAAIATALVVDESLVVPTASLSEDLHGDSLNLIEMIMILEEDFEIDIPDEDAETIETVQQAIDYVLQALSSKPPPFP